MTCYTLSPYSTVTPSGFYCGSFWTSSALCRRRRYVSCSPFNRALAHLNHAVDENIPIDQFPEFFADSRLNYAENALRKRGSAVAITSFSEVQGGTSPSSLSWDDLRDRTCRTTNALKHEGICKNDVVACMFKMLLSLIILSC